MLGEAMRMAAVLLFLAYSLVAWVNLCLIPRDFVVPLGYLIAGGVVYAGVCGIIAWYYCFLFGENFMALALHAMVNSLIRKFIQENPGRQS